MTEQGVMTSNWKRSGLDLISEIPYCEFGDELNRLPRYCGWSIPETIVVQTGWSFEIHGLAKGVHASDRQVGTRWSLKIPSNTSWTLILQTDFNTVWSSVLFSIVWGSNLTQSYSSVWHYKLFPVGFLHPFEKQVRVCHPNHQHDQS